MGIGQKVCLLITVFRHYLITNQTLVTAQLVIG